MKSTLEILMTIMFDAGVFALLLGFVSGKLTDRKTLRAISAAMGVGFVFAEAGRLPPVETQRYSFSVHSVLCCHTRSSCSAFRPVKRRTTGTEVSSDGQASQRFPERSRQHDGRKNLRTADVRHLPRRGVHNSLRRIPGRVHILLPRRGFANAQTGNIVLMSTAFFRSEWGTVLKYLIPVCSFLIGTAVAAYTRETQKMREDTLETD